MVQLVPVEGDPFASNSGPKLVPVDADPFADSRDLKTIRNDYLKALSAGDQAGAKAHAEAFVRKENAESPFLSGINNRARQLAKGVPILGGALDELNAATASIMPGGPSYTEALDYQRAKDRVFEQDRPKESFALQLGGGVASGVGAAAKIAPLLSSAPRAVVLGAGAGGGAAAGATDAFLRGEGGFQNRAQDAVVGGVLGGAVGAAAPVIAKGVTSGVSSAIDALTTTRDLAAMNLSRKSGDILHRTLSADGTLGGRGAGNIAAAGPRGMLADAGVNAAGTLDTVIQRGGPGATNAVRAVQERAGLANQDVAAALNQTLGQPRGILSMEDAMRNGTSSQRAAAYNRAYATPINYASPEGVQLENLMKRVNGDHIGLANRMMRSEGVQSQQILARIADDGAVTFERMPDVRQLDYITRAINQSARSGEGQGALGGQTDIGRIYQNLSREIRDTLRQAVPEYGQALNTAAQPIRAREALRFGETVLSPKTTRDEVLRELRGMSNPERSAVAAGIRSKIDEAVSNVQRMASDPNLDAREATKALRDLSSNAAREKIAAVIGEQPAASLFRQLDEAMRSLELRAQTASNSKTFARQTVKEGIDQQTAPGPLGLLARGQPVQAGRTLVQGLLGTTPESGLAQQDRIYGELAQALTGPRGADAELFMLKLADAYRRKGHGDRAASALGVLAAGGVGGLLYPTIYQQTRPTQ